MKKLLASLLFFMLFSSSVFQVHGQAVPVTKTNPVKVYMHYMPWYDAPENPVAGGNYSWGWHWTFNNRNPNIIDGAGKRQIASHYYPLIGPYSSKDPAVVEYHSLLMKLAGIDGVLMDWYGSEGSNGDVGSLLTNSNALINRASDAGLQFGLIIEDRFWSNIQNARNSITYAKNNYFSRSNFIKSNNSPLVGVFGPITYQSPAQWTDILSSAGQDVEFLPLWYENGDAGSNADGEYAWIYSDYLAGLTNFYANRAPGLKTAMGVAYPGFHDFYVEGGAGSSYFYIPENNGATLNETLGKYDQYKSNLDFLQLATFNDFGEGTIFEPTLENGYKYLVRIQQYTGVPYTQADLEQVYRLFKLRKKYLNDATKQSQLNQVFNYFAALQISNAISLMNSVDGTGTAAPIISGAATASGTTGTTFSYVIIASNSPTSYGASNLPAGLTINTSTGVISGKTITAGTTSVLISAINAGGTGTKSLLITITAASAQTAYTGTPQNIPGRVEAEAYDKGGQEIAFNDNDATNNGNQYRTTEGVDIEACSEGGYNIGWIGINEWTEYSVNITSAGPYILLARVATPNAGKAFHVEMDGVNVSGPIAIPNTGGWQAWQTVRVTIPTLTTGQKIMRIVMDASDFNLNFIDFNLNATPAAPLISSAVTATGIAGTAFSYTIIASNNPAGYGATGLPNGLSLNTSTGVISGIAATPGIYNATITATNAGGTGSKTLAITITAGTDPSGVITCYKAPGSITVNGSLNEAGWNITRSFSKTVTGTINNNASFGVLWDNTNLYIGARITDANLYSESANVWDDDAVEVYIDANYNKATTYDGKDNQLIKGYNKSSVYSKFAVTGLQHAWAITTNGYTIELAIPWSQLGISAPTAGLNIGFDIGYDDDDNSGTRDGQAVWNGTIDNYQNTAAFGKLTLSATASAAPASRIAENIIAEGIKITSVVLMPNPVTDGKLKVVTSAFKGEVSIEILNAEGKQIQQTASYQNNGSINLDLLGLTKGVYIIRMYNVDRSITRKFVVQ